MTNENWQKVREIFDVALQKEPNERQSYILEACGRDKILLAEIESLFVNFDKLDGFMETPALNGFGGAIETKRKTLEQGRCFGHYEINKQIGVGGMGEIYLAKDKKLERKVAVKILNEKFSREESNLNRFFQEAKAASGLNHPNILTIYEFGQSEDVHYIVSEFIKGKTLREILKQSSLKLSEIIDISIQIASALSAAHEANLVHRDIKPENIMIRPDGFVKVLDFGLAKLVEQKNKSIFGLEESINERNSTAKGVILGTVNYMSPEQAKGERIDERTDIFSLGAVIYEMIAGQTPFAGESISETFANLIKIEPPSLSSFAVNVPDEFQSIVSKMLCKNKGERYQTMNDVLADLKDFRENFSLNEILERTVSSRDQASGQLQTTTDDTKRQTFQTYQGFSQRIKQNKPIAAFVLIALFLDFGALGYYLLMPNKAHGGTKSIAVLPLKPIGTASRDETYEFGIAESIVHQLSFTKGFVVRPLSATRQYTDLAQDPVAAGNEQKVDYVLASNYQLAGGKIRVTSQLINVASGQIEEDYKTEKQADDLFGMQDAIANEVGNNLLARFATAPSNPPVIKRGTANEEAYRCYLQGKNLTSKRSVKEALKAIENFEKAISLDPGFARAHAGMAFAYRASGSLGGGLPREQFEKAKIAVNIALELDNNLAEAYAVRGDLKQKYDWDWDGAEKDLLRAIELEPNNDMAHEVYSNLLAESGRFNEAAKELEIATTINPGELVYERDRGRQLYFTRRYDEAIVQLKRVIEVDEDFRTAYSWLWQAYQMKGDEAQAYEWFMKWQKLADSEDFKLLEKAYETSGWQGVKRKKLELDKQKEHQPNSNLVFIARLCALLGETEQAIDYLDKAIEKRQSQLIMLKADPTFDSLRGDPRYADLLRRVGLK
jgi:serine/threonine protein kinase/Tfp pilus assembly protein PilF